MTWTCITPGHPNPHPPTDTTEVPWLAQRTTLKPRTADLCQRLLTLHILPTLGDLQLKALTPARVREWHAGLATTTGPTAQAQAYRLLRTICNQAVQDGEIPTNPCQIRGAANPRTAERPIPTLTQVHALADRVPDRYRVMILVAAHGGLQFGELTALTHADLQLDDPNLPAVTVRKTMSRVKGKWLVGTPKTDAGMRTVTLPRFLHPLLEGHLKRYVRGGPDALVFATASGRPLARSNWTATFHRAKHEIGLDDIHFHDLRHAAATAAVQTGATLKDTSPRPGNAPPLSILVRTALDEITSGQAVDNRLSTAAAGLAPYTCSAGGMGSIAGREHLARHPAVIGDAPTHAAHAAVCSTRLRQGCSGVSGLWRWLPFRSGRLAALSEETSAGDADIHIGEPGVLEMLRWSASPGAALRRKRRRSVQVYRALPPPG